jgi:hypothetical protein
MFIPHIGEEPGFALRWIALVVSGNSLERWAQSGEKLGKRIQERLAGSLENRAKID